MSGLCLFNSNLVDMRQLRALVLEHMARCLPAEDRCHFFEGKDDCDEGIDIERGWEE